MIIFSFLKFSNLHPKTWAHATSTPYSYGLYYKKSEKGRQFNWTGAKAGVYIYLDRGGRSAEYLLVRGAPLSRWISIGGVNSSQPPA